MIIVEIEIPEPPFVRIHLCDREHEPLIRIEADIDQEGRVRIPGDITLNEVMKQRITNAVLAEFVRYAKKHSSGPLGIGDGDGHKADVGQSG